MRYTFGSTPEYAAPDDGLQISSIKITQLKEEEGLHWTLHVYGLIATRDSLDHRRNLLCQRARDNCQTISQEVCTFSFFLIPLYVFALCMHFLVVVARNSPFN